MSTLAERKCVPCEGGRARALDTGGIASYLRELGTGWQVIGTHHLEREFTFPDFARALAFTNRLGAVAEEQGHHPDIYLTWGRVRVTLWTHAVNGLTENDFILAARADTLL
ncbi:MAG: 4a-hydroxytetrahydrobiopterin dehydratase [Nitrospirae bacterium]|nr:4a-hydroxytetrahydrobiopterin dehydratase [Nitrospirota bacterium]